MNPLFDGNRRYLGECRQWIDQVLPVMEQARQRHPPAG